MFEENVKKYDEWIEQQKDRFKMLKEKPVKAARVQRERKQEARTGGTCITPERHAPAAAR